MKTYVFKKTYTKTFEAALFMIARRDSLGVHGQDNQ